MDKPVNNSEPNVAAKLQKVNHHCRKENDVDSKSINGPFPDPVFKKMSEFNGAVNKMTKEELKEKLAQWHLDTRGHKDVLKKRLKNHFKRRQLARTSGVGLPKKAHCDYFIVIDFEATCEQNAVKYPHEIIEFPAILVSAADGTVVDEFHSIVRPTRNPRLTEYCKQLTNISQEQVDTAPTFVEVLEKMEEWMMRHRLGHGKKFAIVTDGPWDMSRFMYMQCRTSRIMIPKWATRWVNIRKTYCNSYKVPRINILTMLEYLGLSFEGRQHCGLDDARNIARILAYMISDGCDIYINERIYPSKLASLSAEVDDEGDAEVSCVRQDETDEDSDKASDECVVFADECTESASCLAVASTDASTANAEMNDKSECVVDVALKASEVNGSCSLKVRSDAKSDQIEVCVSDLNALSVHQT